MSSEILKREGRPDLLVVECDRCGATQDNMVYDNSHPYKSGIERAWDQLYSYAWRSISGYDFCSGHFPNSFVDTMLP